jgi:hypothetical protein
MPDDPRTDLVGRIEAIRARWHQLVADVGEDRMELPGAMGEWTFKDLASHMTAWRRKTVGRLQATARGEPPPPTPWAAELGEEETDPVNAWIHDRTKDDPLPAVLSEAASTYDAMIAAVRAMPVEDAARERAAWDEAEVEDGHPYGHLGEHETGVRRWLEALPGDRR